MAQILIVDDSKTVREMMARLVQSLGFNYIACESGEDGLLAAQESAFDLILTDYNMPNMNGFEMAKRIKEESTINSRTPIVCITSHANETLKKHSKEFMITGWMLKPVKEDHLSSLIKRVLHDK